MERIGSTKLATWVSDGVVSIALLLKETEDEQIGIDHFGVWVDDMEKAAEQATKAGANVLRYETPSDERFYEAKFKTPDGIVFDLTHTGWPGAIKEPGQESD